MECRIIFFKRGDSLPCREMSNEVRQRVTAPVRRPHGHFYAGDKKSEISLIAVAFFLTM